MIVIPNCENVSFGSDIKVIQPVNIYKCVIGSHVRIGPFVEIQQGVVIGDFVKIGSHSFLCRGVTIGNEVFIGHSVFFCNDRYPISVVFDEFLKKKRLKVEKDWTCEKIIVEDGASIGSGVVILPGIRIGKKAFVGAGSVVVKDVGDNQRVIGNPAKPIR